MTQSQVMKPEDIKKQEKEEGLVRVCVAIPNEGHTQVEAYGNRLMNFMHLGKLEAKGKALKEKPRFEFYFITLGRIFTPLAREEAARMALEADMDYLYMIDDDMMCPDDMFEKLYRHDIDVIAPLAFTRNFPHKPVLYSIIEGWDTNEQCEYFINHVVMNYPKDQLVQCDAVGFGAVLIKMDVIKAIKTPRFMSSCGTGEDILFCHKARKAGFKVYMDTSIKLGHLSHPIQVTENYVQDIWKRTNMEVEKRNGAYDKYEAKVILGDK